MPSKTSLVIVVFSLCMGFFFPLRYAKAQANCGDQWVCKIVSIQGQVLARHGDETSWQAVKIDETLCPGSRIQVGKHSRAAVVLSNEAVLRLDQNTTLVLTGIEAEKSLIIRLIEGAAHFFSRKTRSLKVVTPFVNGVVEGTEFLVHVRSDRTLISLFEGRLLAENEKGELMLARGESAVAWVGQAPRLEMVVHPRDAVQWALYYPPLFFYRQADFHDENLGDNGTRVRESVGFVEKGDLIQAFKSLDGVFDADIRDPLFFTFRAGLSLIVGDVSAATKDIQRALILDPENGEAFSLLSVIAVTQNRKPEALDLAFRATTAAPESVAVWIASSYSRQADFDLRDALNDATKATSVDPESAMAWARLSELYLSFGYLDKALSAARKSTDLNPNLSHTQSVLGFAYLTQIKIKDSKAAFEKAIALDSAAPLPRLGLGLAKIREGHLEQGRAEIEIAAGLDPDNSLIRSYLGKAYFEEKRDPLDGDQFEIAKQLDPKDPTPWFYDAIRKQTINRPVEALHDLQKSIELNDNRAVYRSRFLLDEDLAARSVSLGRIYDELGFEQMAIVDGCKSINIDPSIPSAHRFLSDMYASQLRHEIARVSELLQAQLLQSVNVNPMQPQLAESNLGLFSDTELSQSSFNEYAPLFSRNQSSLIISEVFGNKNTRGTEGVVAGLWDKMSLSAGGVHYTNDGFRENNDQEQNIYDLFTQVAPYHNINLMAEYRRSEKIFGDLPIRFNPEIIDLDGRFREQSDSVRFSLHHSYSPKSDLIGTIIFGDYDFNYNNYRKIPENYEMINEDIGNFIEIQHIYRSQNYHYINGLGILNADRTDNRRWSDYPEITKKDDLKAKSLYSYFNLNLPSSMIWTAGASFDIFEGIVDKSCFNPKLGFTWNPFTLTTLRASLTKSLRHPLIANQTIQPTQVAGLNQFFYDYEGTEAWRYGVGLDQRFGKSIFGGVELSRRKLDVPYLDSRDLTDDVRWEEMLFRSYLYWVPWNFLSTSIEYEVDKHNRDVECTGLQYVHQIVTHKIPVGVNVHLPFGLKAGFFTTYVIQEGIYQDPRTPVQDPRYFETEKGGDRFWIMDATLRYRLPKRSGFLSLEIKNLTDRGFFFQSMDDANPEFVPERWILGKVTLTF